MRMISLLHIPSAPLSHFVACFYYYEGFNPEHRMDRFLPDGNTEIIIDLTDQPKYIYDNELLTEKQECRHVWASGVRTEYITIPSGRESAMLVIYFKKGMAFPFFPVPMYEMNDRVLDSDLLWNRCFLDLREMILAEPDYRQRFLVAENYLARAFGSRFTPQPCIEYAVQHIIHSPDELSLKQLTQKIGYSQKHFIDLFKRHVGVTPKKYLRIHRFQKAIHQLEKNGDTDWARLAQDCGYFDQAHFIHDFRRFSGFTPQQYMQKKNDSLNYVPVG